MTAKEYLIDLKKNWLYVQSKQRDCDRLKRDAAQLRGSSNRPKVSDSNIADLSDTLAKIDDAMRENWDSRNSYLDRKARAIRWLGRMSDATHAAILYDRYINCMSWEEIAVQMHYSYHHVIKMHGQALRELDELIQNDT
jgi:hypothetical protein